MEQWLPALILGVVEGLTEFLPVSSTGHLIIAGELLDFTGPKVSTFEVMIQLGAILAVVVLYWSKFVGLFFPNEHNTTKDFSGVRGLFLLFLTCLPASVLGLMAHGFIKSHLFNPASVVLALVCGALFMLLVERMHLQERVRSLDALTPRMALGIGCFQCLALWPGFSRSASTIMGGMLLGAQRSVAAEYSFLAAVPIMFAATGYDLLKSWQYLAMADIPFFAVGMVCAFLSAYAAIKTFIALVSRYTLRPFAWYRLVLAPLVWFFMVY